MEWIRRWAVVASSGHRKCGVFDRVLHRTSVVDEGFHRVVTGAFGPGHSVPFVLDQLQHDGNRFTLRKRSSEDFTRSHFVFIGHQLVTDSVLGEEDVIVGVCGIIFHFSFHFFFKSFVFERDFLRRHVFSNFKREYGNKFENILIVGSCICEKNKLFCDDKSSSRSQ